MEAAVAEAVKVAAEAGLGAVLYFCSGRCLEVWRMQFWPMIGSAAVVGSRPVVKLDGDRKRSVNLAAVFHSFWPFRHPLNCHVRAIFGTEMTTQSTAFLPTKLKTMPVKLARLPSLANLVQLCPFGPLDGTGMSSDTLGSHRWHALRLRRWGHFCIIALGPFALQHTFASVPKLPSGSHRPKQQLGQSYLTDPNTINKIVESFHEACKLRMEEMGPVTASTASILELGPGLGALTRFLAELFPASKLLAVDIDPRAVERLRTDMPELQVRLQDLLTLNHSEVKLQMGSAYVEQFGTCCYFIFQWYFFFVRLAVMLLCLHFCLSPIGSNWSKSTVSRCFTRQTCKITARI